VRDNYLAALPLMAAWLAVRPRWGGRGRPFAAAAWVLGVFLAILPVTIRNYAVSGELVLTTSGGGEVFYVGNNPNANGLYQYPIFVRPDPQFEHEDFRARAREETGRDLSRGEASRFWWRKGFEYVTSEPMGAAALYLRKLALMWNAEEVADNYSFAFFRSDVSPVLRIPIGFSLLAALGLVGVAVTARRWRACLPLYLFELSYMAGLVLFFIHSRYRLPLVPVLVVFSAAAVVRGIEAWRAAAWKPLGIAAASGAAVYLFTLLPLVPDSYSNRWNFYEKLGVAYLEDGDPARARVALERSRSLNDRNPNVHYNLGLVAQAEGDYREAYAHYQRAVELSPLFRGAHEKIEILSKLTDVGLFDSIEKMRRDLRDQGLPPARVHLEIGKKLLSERVLVSAIAELEEAVRLDPSVPESHLRLAEAYSRGGEHAKAIETMKAWVAGNPGDAAALAALARCYIMATRFEEAREILLRARSVDPGRLEVYFHLGQAEAGLGRPADARRAYRQYLDRGATGPGAEMARQALRELDR
jgi:tetratricopeptide (TPR) repeat protein